MTRIGIVSLGFMGMSDGRIQTVLPQSNLENRSVRVSLT